MKKYLLLAFAFFIITVPAAAQESGPAIPEQAEISYEKAEIVKVESFSQFDDAMDQVVEGEKVEARILGGDHEGELSQMETLFYDKPLDVSVETGEKIIVQIQDFPDGKFDVSIFDRYRIPWLVAMVILFLVCLALIGGKQGLKAILSLVLSIALIWWVLIPAVLKGWNALWLTIALSVIVTVVTLLVVSGSKKKTWAAILGTTAGVLCATLLAVIFGHLSQSTGLASNEAHSVYHINNALNFRNILFASITIGALGAIMDVGISIASAIAEVKEADPKLTFGKLYHAGLNVGKDVMGTMSNTLIFAYVGSSLFMLLLFASYEQPLMKLLNFNFIADEIVRAMAGSIGLIGAIPLTAFIAAYLESRHKKNSSR